MERKYWHPEYTHSISVEDLRSSDRDFQKEVVKAWFLTNYENPAEHTPYESAEGGFIYIWGGPYNAKQEILEEFYEIIEEELIEEIAEELEEQEGCYDWSGTISSDDFDDYLFETIEENTEFHSTFQQSATNTLALLELEVDKPLEQSLLKLLYVNVITAIETYLSDALMNTVLKNPTLIRRFVETNPKFGERKLSLNKIYERMDSLIDEVKAYLLELQYHNLAKIKAIYKSVLDINFPDDLAILFKAVLTRHDIIHRSGKTKEGSSIELNKGNVIKLIEVANSFVDDIDAQLTEKSNNVSS